MVRDMLNQSSEVFCHGEVFTPGAKRGIEIQKLRNILGTYPAMLELEDGDVGWGDPRPYSVVGFTAHRTPMTTPRVYDLLMTLFAMDYKIILLYRHSVLDQFISYELATLFKTWNRRRFPQGKQVLTFDEDKFLKFRQMNVEWAEVCRQLFTNQSSNKMMIPICYENIMEAIQKQDRQFWDSVTEFIGCEEKPDLPMPDSVRQRTTEFEDYLTNPEAYLDLKAEEKLPQTLDELRGA